MLRDIKDFLGWLLSGAPDSPAPQPVRAIAEAEDTELLIERVVAAAGLRVGFLPAEIDELKESIRELGRKLDQLQREIDGGAEAAAALDGRDAVIPFTPADAACGDQAGRRTFHLRTTN